MAIAKRTSAPTIATINPTPRRPEEPTPTRGGIQVAARFLASQWGQPTEWAKGLFDFAVTSKASARALVAFAIYLARCQVAETKIAIGEGAPRWKVDAAEKPLVELKAALKAAREADKNAGGDRILDVEEGRKLTLSVPERRILVDRLGTGFNPPIETPVAEELYRTLVGFGGCNLRMSDALYRAFLDEVETVAYEDELKAARAADAGSPAPDAEEEVEAPASPAVEPAAVEAPAAPAPKKGRGKKAAA